MQKDSSPPWIPEPSLSSDHTTIRVSKMSSGPRHLIMAIVGEAGLERQGVIGSVIFVHN